MKNFNLKELSQEDTSDAKEHGQRKLRGNVQLKSKACASLGIKELKTEYVIHLASTCVTCLNSFTWRKIGAVARIYCFLQQCRRKEWHWRSKSGER